MTTNRDNSATTREDLILSLIEGDLDPAMLAALDPDAAARVVAMRRHRAALMSVAEVAPPAGLLNRVGASLEREAVTGPAIDHRTFRLDDDRRPTLWLRRMAVAAGLALMVGGVGYWSLWLSQGPRPSGPAIAMNGESARRELPTEDRSKSIADIFAKAEREASMAGAPEPESIHEPVHIAGASGSAQEPLPSSIVDFDDPLAPLIAEADSEAGPAFMREMPGTTIAQGETAVLSSVPLGMFQEMPGSLDLEDAARLAEEGRLVIRVRADRPALAAARLLSQADSRADKGRLWRLMPCPPSDFSAAVESAMPPERTADNSSGVTVPFRVPIRPTVEATLSVELDPSIASLAIVQSELESISEGAVIFDVLDRPVTMAPPCGDDGGLRRWTSAPSSAVHSVVVPLVVESSE